LIGLLKENPIHNKSCFILLAEEDGREYLTEGREWNILFV